MSWGCPSTFGSVAANRGDLIEHPDFRGFDCFRLANLERAR
jgi:hypothetical protein